MAVVVAGSVVGAPTATAVVTPAHAAQVQRGAAAIVDDGGGVVVARFGIRAAFFGTDVGLPHPAPIGARVQRVLGLLNFQVKHFHVGQADVEVFPCDAVPGEDPNVGAGIDFVGGSDVVGQAVHRHVGQPRAHGVPAPAGVGRHKDFVAQVGRQGNEDPVGVGRVDLNVGDEGVGKPTHGVPVAAAISCGPQASLFGNVHAVGVGPRHCDVVEVARTRAAQCTPRVAEIGGFEHAVFAQIKDRVIAGILDERGFPVASRVGSCAPAAHNVGEVVVGINAVERPQLIGAIEEPPAIVVGVLANVNFKAIGTAHVLPVASIEQDGAVVLQTRSDLTCLVLSHTNLIHLADAHSVGDVAVADPLVCRGVDATIAGDYKGVVFEGEAVDVGMHFCQSLSTDPMGAAHPAVSAIGGFPDVDAGDHHDIGLGGMGGDAQVVPALARVVAARGGIPQHVRGAFVGNGGPGDPGILAHIEVQEAAAFAGAGHHVNAVGGTGRYGDAIAVHVGRARRQADLRPRLSAVGGPEKPGVGRTVDDVRVGGVELDVPKADATGA